MPQPDIAVYRGTFRDYSDHPTNPILVVEVSDSTLGNDLTIKLELYAEAGVPEYWVLDVEGRELHQFTQPRALVPGGFSYGTHRTIAPDGVVEAPGTAQQLQVSAMLP